MDKNNASKISYKAQLNCKKLDNFFKKEEKKEDC